MALLLGVFSGYYTSYSYLGAKHRAALTDIENERIAKSVATYEKLIDSNSTNLKKFEELTKLIVSEQGANQKIIERHVRTEIVNNPVYSECKISVAAMKDIQAAINNVKE